MSVRGVLLGAFVAGLGVSISLAETALALLTLHLLWRLRDPAERAAARWPLWPPVLAFSAVTILSALLSRHPVASLESAKGLLLVAALYVTADAVRDPVTAGRFLFGVTLAATVAAVVGLLQVGLCPGLNAPAAGPRWLYHRCDRAHGFFSIYMTLAGVLSLVLLATLPRLLPGIGGLRRFGAPWLVMLGGLVATYTRGAWIGFAAGVLTVAASMRRGRWLLLAGLVLLAAGALMAPYELRHRFLSMADPEEAGVRERVYMWRSGLAMWRERPVLGVGPGGVKREYPPYALPEAVKKRTGHVHSTPLQILVERGVLGLAAWLAIWAAFFTRCVGLLRRLPAEATAERVLVVGSLAAIVGFLMGGLSEYNFGDSEVVMVAWALMALPWATQQAREPRASRAG
ncbi:MAG TPA: O-antigen ligase family protein [Methylomirabilota bacterium]|nr:O-antigen ligase family protein [Methylomirabilota bacterium]